MTMPLSGIKSEMDEEAVIEAEIQQQLDLIDLGNDEVNNNNDDARDEIPLKHLQDIDDADDEEFVVDEARDYLGLLQKQTERFEKELTECDDLLNYHKPGDIDVTEDIDELLEAAKKSGVDPQELRKKILEAIEKEDETEDVEEAETAPDKTDTSLSGDPVFVTSEVELLAGRQDECKDHGEEFEENLTLEPAEGVMALVDEIQTQEAFFKQQLQDMDVKYQERETRWKQESEMRRKEEEERENLENEKRKQVMLQYAEEKVHLEEQNKIAQHKLDAEVEEKRKIIQDEVRKFEEQITLLESETRREQEELEKSVHNRQEKRKHQETIAATTLQAGFRGYRVRKTSRPVLKEKREERAKVREMKRIEEVEQDIQKRKEDEKKKEEEIKSVEKEKQETEERKLREEKERLEAERKKKEEMRLEEEKKKREEEIRQAEEKRKKQEEEKKREEERKKKEEEKREKEKERQEKEEERKKKEAERIEKVKKEQEEKKRKDEEDRLKREEEERKLQEEKEKEMKAEEERLRKEKSLEEENERLKEELKKMKEQTNQAPNDTSETEKEIKTVKENLETKQSQGTEDKAEHDKSSRDLRQSISEKRQQFERAVAGDPGSDGKDTLGRTLPQHTEAKRLAWIKECLPWSKISNEPWKLKGGVSKKPPRRPSSAKKLPPLAEGAIIAAARVATLKQVTTVQLSDLPGCNLSTLGQCWGLKSLTMTNCNLVAVDGLQQCRQLQYLSMKRNKLEYIDLKDLGNLQVVDLSNNNLSVVHGLDGCTNVRWLDLSCNRITRLGGLDPLRRVHTLLLSSNQLISCSGISDVPTLQYLDLSNNHLQGLDGLHKLCLLQRLNVSANNLLQFPDVRNQVLLEDCDLSDNSISSLEDLTTYWLPMLSKINLSKNSLNELEVLDNLILLKNLDVSNNQLLDMENISSSLSCHARMEELSFLDNPATEDMTYKERLTQLFPRLQTMDGMSVRVGEDSVLQPNTDFEIMCITHAQFHSSIRNTFLQELQSMESKSPVDDLAMCDVYFRYCDKSFKLAVEHRYSHEYGEVSINIPVAPATPKSGRPRSSRAKLLHTEAETYLSPKEMFEKALKSDDKINDAVQGGIRDVGDNPKDLFEKALKSIGEDSSQTASQTPVMEDPKNLFAKALETQTAKHMESGKDAFEKSIQNIQPKVGERTEPTPATWSGRVPQTEINLRASLQNLPPDEIAILQELHNSATKIQALWRGYILRLKLSAALEYARMEGEDDISELGDFNMEDIAFDEETLEKGWRPAETPQIPHSHPVLGKPPTGRHGGSDVLKLELAPVHPPNRPRHAWRNMDSPLSDLAPHPPRPPSSIMSASDTHRTALSKKEEKLAEEWGFHNSRTAELMLQRAKKMKLNSDRKRKLSRLDPKQRLALFRKLEEVTKLSPIRPPVRKTLPRKEYFQDASSTSREEEVHRQEYEKRREAQTRSTRTYEWLHTQVASLDTQTDRNLDRQSNFGSEGNLSELTGSHRMHMMNYGGLDADSSKDERRARRFSSGESISNSGQTTYLPPIKTNSAGSSGSNGGQRHKEKMSWRTKPTDVDVGWGGGRKRQANN